MSGPRIIVADPLRKLVGVLLEEARAQREPRFGEVLKDTAERIEAAIRAGATLQDVSTAEAAAVLEIAPDSVATACRRGKVPGARKIAGTWRIPVSALETGRAA